jgi:hypothetical protein
VIDGTQKVDTDHARRLVAQFARKISDRLGWFGPEEDA